ncbi:hypothetical protein QUA13_27730, partial [Microcoleus sp. S28C3]
FTTLNAYFSLNSVLFSRSFPSGHYPAFDKGLITFDEDYRLIISAYLESFLPDETLYRNFVGYCGQQIHFPNKFHPDPDFIRRHRQEVFIGKEITN